MNLKTLYRELISHNPMTVEVLRFRRKYFNWGGPTAQSSAVVALGLIIYAALFLIVISSQGYMPPHSLVHFMLSMFLLLIPGMLHGAIAGERERRSWDLLMVAPVSKAQIVAGKFLAAGAGVVAVAGACLLPIVFAGITYRRTDWGGLVMSALVMVSFSLLLAAFTLFMSGRVKRPFMALGTVFGAEVVGLLVMPSLLATGGADKDFVIRFIETFHPFMLIESINAQTNAYAPETNLLPVGLNGPPQIFSYLFLTLFFLAWTERTLSFADNEVKFLPKRKP